MKQVKEEFRCSGILLENLDETWPFVEKLITYALEYADGKYRVEHILQGIKDQKMQLWVVSGSQKGVYSVCVTQVINYPAKKTMLILLCAGEHMAVWLHYINVLKDFAKANQCVAIEEYGRPGWAKYLGKLGFKTIHTVCSLNLIDGAPEHEKDIHQDGV